MRLHRLEIEGFGPFLERQSVDFDAFTEDGIFLIAGRTGAGKSSILDAVCFGLYGGVPRYDGGEKRLRSDHCEPDDPTSVTVEFSTVAGRFRVTRSPAYDRPAKRGGGTTTQPATALLEKWDESDWVGLAARAGDVGRDLDEILQLSQEQFLQVILLAQNRFAEFLLADSKERQALLRRLFGTERFSDYQARFDERRRAAEQSLLARRTRLDARLGEAERTVTDADLDGADATPLAESAGVEERLTRLRQAVARAAYQVERCGTEVGTAVARLNRADTALAELKEQRQAQTDRDRARGALARLDAEQPDIDAAVTARDRARAAALLERVIDVDRRLQTERADAVAAEATAIAAATAVGVTPPDAEGADESVAASYRAWAAERTKESGAWQRAATLEAQTSARETERTTARRALEDHITALTAVEVEREALPEQIAELTRDRDAAVRGADRAPEAAQAVERAERRHAGAVDAERLAAAITKARQAESEATEAHTHAQTALAQLRRRRLEGQAGELALALVPGEPCAVCGAVEHPAPAEHTDPVSSDDIAAAESARDAAAETERAASRHVATQEAAHAAAAERSGGLSVADAEAEVAKARAAHTAATEAAEHATRLATELLALEQRAADVAERRASAAERAQEAQTALTLLDERHAEAALAIDEARGPHDTVRARLDEAQRQIDAAVTAADAVDHHRDLARRAESARAERDEAITASPFDDAAAAQHAMLPAGDIDALDERITEHAAARKKERATLLDLEMRVLPEEPIDLQPAQDQADTARAAWIASVDSDAQARSVHGALVSLVDSAESEHAASAEDTEEYEVLRGLADALAGRSGNTHKMTLETFVLAAELEEIVAAANVRLHAMSDGRYQLRHSDARAARGATSGLGIVVFDAFTGHTRPARSLSGGETFLSSLALALGLAEVVTARAGGIRLDTLFIDEGFGSLDAETLEAAMRTLDELRQGGRTVGVISHVEAMQEQIPAQLNVHALPDGPSVIDAPRGA